jgi:hypothetical protein
VFAVGVTLHAGPVSFNGTFSFDSSVQLFYINAASPSSINILSFGYGGGTNGASQVIPAGGFAPSLALYDNSGNLLAQDALGGTFNAGTCSNGRTPDPTVHLCLDPTLNYSTGTGSYVLALSEQGNDGQNPQGFPLTPGTNATTPPFQDPFGNQRNGNWALDFTVTGTVSQVPEPAAGLMTLLGLPVLFLCRRRLSFKG